ncbi:MAG TPA: hypothetical protein VHN14_33990 [Kofleriaceae bacterium]|jgi:hypothetical protein|nr:hypothetical protein [Kofleriaceae bacterium]
MRNHHAWLQKHPSPLTAGGEFHWYPAVPAASDRELRAGFVERVRGIEPPAVLWQIERGRVAWGQVFSATAPLDGRRYVGLVLSVIEGDRPVPDLLAMLAPPPPAPWTEGIAAESRGRDLAVQALGRMPRTPRGDVVGVVRALLSGGSAEVDDPTSEELPSWIASIERVLLAPGPRPRCGAWCTGGARGPRDRVAELAAAAWREPAARAASAWTLLCELSIARGESVDHVGRALEAIDAGAALTATERAGLDRGGRVVDVLHAWGRGRFDRSPDADTLAARLADLVALRVLARLAGGEDAGGAIAEARWYALLPGSRREALLAAVAERTALLRVLVEAHHA